MADLDFTVNADTSNAQRNLQRLDSNIENLRSGLNLLKGAIAGLALGNFITQSINLGIELNKLSNASGVSAEAIRGFQLAVSNSGGTSAQAADAISDLTKNIGEAAAGSGKLQTAFRKVGVGLDDLKTLSEEDILSKTIKGLAGIPDKSVRSANAMKIFGEAVKTVDFGNVNNGVAGFTAASAGFGASAKTAADAQQKLTDQVNRLQGALLKALTPMLDFISKLDSKQIENFIDAIVKLAVAMTALAASFKIFAWLGTALGVAAAAFIALKQRMIVFSVAATYTSGTVAKTLLTFAGLKTFLTSLIPILGTVAGKFVLLSAAIVGASIAINEAVKYAFNIDPIDAMARKLEELVRNNLPGVARIIEGIGAFLGTAPLDPREGMRGRGDPEEIKNREKAAAANREIIDQFKKQADAIRKVSSEFKRQNNEIIDNINFEKALVGKSEDYIEVEKARAAILKKAADETYKLRQAKAELTKNEQGLAAVYDAQIAAINKAAQADADRVARSTKGIIDLRNIEKSRIDTINATVAGIDRMSEAETRFRDTMRDVQNQMNDLDFEKMQRGRTPLERQIELINENARKAAKAAGEALMQGVDESTTSPADIQRLNEGLANIVEKYKDIAAAQIDNLNASRTWNQGWKDAFNDYVDNATNAAMIASDIFRSMTKNVEDSLVNMAKTGKFQWKNMLASMAEDLLRSQIRQLLSSLLGGKSATGGGSVIMGTIGSILGFRANGGPVMAGSPYIVGERGPELMIPNTNGTVVPNNALGGGTVIYNINAVDALSFKQMVARDPSFIHAVATQGGKSIPGTRR